MSERRMEDAVPTGRTARYRPHAETGLTAVAFILLDRIGLLGAVSIWVLLGLLAFATLLRTFTDWHWPPEVSTRGLYIRIALGTFGSTLVIYATGWGPMLALGYMFTATMNIRHSGSRAANPAMIWSVAGILGGQSAIALGIAPTLIDEPLVHGLAALAALGIVFSMRHIGVATEEREAAEGELAASLERERASFENLRRLHESMKTVASSLELKEMLDSVASSAKDTFGAAFAVVLLKEPDDFVIGSLQGREQLPELQQYSKEASRKDAGPSAVALATGDPVVVRDFENESDARFSRCADVAKSLGVRSMVAAPLIAEEEALGVLNICFSEVGAIDEEDVAMLMVYAQEATVALARAQAYDQERQSLERLREADQMKDEFLSTLSHELRTPLTSIGGLTDTLIHRWDRLDDVLRLDLLKRVARNAKEMGHLVEQLLDVSSLEAGAVEVRPRPMQLVAQVRECVDRLSGLLGNRPVSVEIDEGIYVGADPDGLSRILGNLLTNAARFSAEGSPIRVGAQSEGAEVIVSVADEGAGIVPEEQSKIFERFYQGSGRRAGRSGTGVGLNIARHYTEMQGGRIWVESELGKGSTFFFSLPGPHATPRARPKRVAKVTSRVRPKPQVQAESREESSRT